MNRTNLLKMGLVALFICSAIQAKASCYDVVAPALVAAANNNAEFKSDFVRNLNKYNTWIKDVKLNLENGKSNIHVYAAIKTELRNQAASDPVSAAFVWCIRPQLNFNSSTSEQLATATKALAQIKNFNKAVR